MVDRPDPHALARDALAGLGAARVALTNLAAALEGGLQCPVKGASNAATWRAAHRPGRPSRIESDPELLAFIAARIDRLTFEEVIAEIRASLKPERPTSCSAPHRWWHRTGKFSATAIGQIQPTSPDLDIRQPFRDNWLRSGREMGTQHRSPRKGQEILNRAAKLLIKSGCPLRPDSGRAPCTPKAPALYWTRPGQPGLWR